MNTMKLNGISIHNFLLLIQRGLVPVNKAIQICDRKRIVGLFVVGVAFLGFAKGAPKRVHPVPDGWTDDIDAAVAKAKAEKKDIFVYFPLRCDRIGINGNMFSAIKASTNPKVTEVLSRDFVPLFFPWDYNRAGKWQELMEYTGAATPSYLVISANMDLFWKGNCMMGLDDISTWKSKDFEEKLGLGFARDVLPRFKSIMPKLQAARKQCENIADEREKAKIMYEVFNLDKKIAIMYFSDECEKMVKADRDGTLGIREEFPFFWIVKPLLDVRLDFLRANYDRSRKLCDKDKTMSYNAARKTATMAMKDEWMPKLQKVLKVAKKAEGKVLGDDLLEVKNLEKEVEGYLKFWNGQSDTAIVQ